MSLPKEYKAWTYSTIRGRLEESLDLADIPMPAHFISPPSSKVLVEVLAASLNPADFKIPESAIESRVIGLPKPATPGLDYCGRIVAHPDRLVFGRLPWPDQYGTLGQYILVSEKDFADLPHGVSLDLAAAVPIAALTAYQSLKPWVQKGDRVLCNGGSGGVGTFTIQIAKLLGCYVVATCSSRNMQLCKELGADEVIDYTKGDIVAQLASHNKFDLLIDNVGQDTSFHQRSAAIMKQASRFVLVSGMLGSFAGICSMAESFLRPSWLGGSHSRFSIVLCQSNKQQLEQIGGWISEEKIKVIIDEAFSFQDAPQAMAKLRTGRAQGKIVVHGVYQTA